MIKINTTKPYNIFAEVIEQEALNQFEAAMQLEYCPEEMSKEQLDNYANTKLHQHVTHLATKE